MAAARRLSTLCRGAPPEIAVALKSTIFRAELRVADIDRGYYADHALTLARHPSETDERMMLRLVAFALNADPALSLCRGLSESDEPDLWQRDLTGTIELWIDLGQPDERRIQRACGRAERVEVIAYGNAAQPWWKGVAAKLERFPGLDVRCVTGETLRALAPLACRNMRLDCTVQEGHLLIADGRSSVDLAPIHWKRRTN